MYGKKGFSSKLLVTNLNRNCFLDRNQIVFKIILMKRVDLLFQKWSLQSGKVFWKVFVWWRDLDGRFVAIMFKYNHVGLNSVTCFCMCCIAHTLHLYEYNKSVISNVHMLWSETETDMETFVKKLNKKTKPEDLAFSTPDIYHFFFCTVCIGYYLQLWT